MSHATLAVLAIVFLATLIRSAFGFGEALVAVPLLAFFVPLRVAAPLAVLLSITIAAIVVVQDWRAIHRTAARWLLVATLGGIPLGVLLLACRHQGLVKASLALILIAFSGCALAGPPAPRLRRDSRRWLLGCGFLAGVLGGAYGMNGPPLVAYGAMRRWPPQQFRATLQAYFLPASVMGMAGYWLAGLWVPLVTHYFLLSLLPMLPAVGLGRVLNRRISADAFRSCLYAGLAGVGALLLLQVLWPL